MFDLIPLFDFAVEGSYVDLGKISSTQIGNNDVSITGWDVFGLAGFKLGLVGLIGKLGTMAWSSNSSTNQAGLDASGNNPVYGIGARFQLWSIGIRADCEIFQTDATNVDYGS